MAIREKMSLDNLVDVNDNVVPSNRRVNTSFSRRSSRFRLSTSADILREPRIREKSEAAHQKERKGSRNGLLMSFLSMIAIFTINVYALFGSLHDVFIYHIPWPFSRSSTITSTSICFIWSRSLY